MQIYNKITTPPLRKIKKVTAGLSVTFLRIDLVNFEWWLAIPRLIKSTRLFW